MFHLIYSAREWLWVGMYSDGPMLVF